MTDALTAKDIPEWDSMNYLLFIADLEKEYNVSFTMDEVLTANRLEWYAICCVQKARMYEFAGPGNLKLPEVGDTFSFERIIEEKDVDAFAELSGDHSPIHADDAYASTTHYGKRLVHGMFLGAWVSRLVGMELSQKDRVFVCMKVSVEFKKPVYIGDAITLTGTVASASTTLGIVELVLQFARTHETVAVGSAYAQLLK